MANDTAPTNASDNDALVEVYSPANILQATLLTQTLEDAGVDCRIVNDTIRGVAGEIPFTKADPQILVRSRDFETAVAICREFDEQVKQRGRGEFFADDTPFCFHCGETVAADARRCPACGGRLT